MARNSVPDAYAQFLISVPVIRAVPVLVIDPHKAWGGPIKPYYSREQMLTGVPMIVSCNDCGHTKELTFKLDPSSMKERKELAPRATGAMGLKCSSCGRTTSISISPVPEFGPDHVR